MPRQPQAFWEDGIRSVRPEEFESLERLIGDVFFPGLTSRQPHVFNRENAGNLRVVVKDGQVVSHIGTIRRRAVIYGCGVYVASLGGVATYEAHRGKGYADALVEDTMRVCREDGVDFILVSGYRNMYHRHGCRYVGKDWTFNIPADRAGAVDDGLTADACTEADIPTLVRLYRHELVRWVRPPRDYTQMVDGYAANRRARTYLIHQGGFPRAFVVLQQPSESEERSVRVLDYAGDRVCIAGALGRFFVDHRLSDLSIHVAGCDRLLEGALSALGFTGVPTNAPGTVLIIHFELFMDKMRPYFEEVLGSAADGLVFREQGDQMIFQFGRDRVVAESRGRAAQIIFGTLDDAEAGVMAEGGSAGEVLREIFPLPGLRYGVNYV